MPEPQFVKFCPVCGNATTTTSEHETVIGYCASCGADLSIYELYHATDLVGQQLATLPSPFDTSVIHRSNVTVAGHGHEKSGAAGHGGTGAQIADSIIQRSVVTNIGSLSITKASSCPLCENLITEANPLGVCPSCQFKFCHQCSTDLDARMQPRYRGYQLEFADGLCPQCYHRELNNQKTEIDTRVAAARMAGSRSELFSSYSEREQAGLGEGDKLLALGNFLDALGVYEKVLDINAANALARQGVWTALFQLERFDRIIEFTTPFVADPPADLGNEVFYIRGAAFKAMEEFDQAKTEFIRLTKLNPNDPLPLIRIGETYLAEGIFQRARQVFERAVQLDRDGRFIEPHLYLADLALRQNDYSAVEPALEHAMAIDASDPVIEQFYAQLRHAREYCHQSINDLQKELRSLDTELRSEPDPTPATRLKVARTASRLADLQVALGLIPAARKSYERAMTITGISGEAPARPILNTPETLVLLEKYARVLEKLDDRSGATEIYKRMLALKPDNPPAIQALNRLG